MFGYQVAMLLTATIVFPCIIGIPYFKRLPSSYKLIVLLLLFGFFTEVLLIFLPYFGVNNFLISHIYALGEIILLSLFFILRVKRVKEKRLIRIAMMGLAGFALIYSIIGNNIAEFNSIPRTLECIYFSGLSCYVFYEMTIDPGPKEDDSFYCMNGAILFYFSSCFIVFAFSKYVAQGNDYLLLMHNVHSIVSAMCNITFALGLWISSRSAYSVA
jgi:hypothetical protein